MSIRVISLVWENAFVEGNELLVLLALGDWANDEGLCWPSIPRLATKTRVSERTVQRLIRSLESKGILTIEEGGGRGRSSHYQINGDKLTGFNPERVTPRVIKGDTAMSPDPLVDPSTLSLEDLDLPFPTEERGYGGKHLSPPDIEALVAEFSEGYGGEANVRTVIDEALNHKASAKWINKRKGLQVWLRNELEWRPDRFRSSRSDPQAERLWQRYVKGKAS